MTASKIVFLDIETTPLLGWAWGPVWETNIIEVVKESHILSFAWKYADEKEVHTRGLIDYPSFKQNKDDDEHLVKDLWKVMDSADVIIAHNGDRFDILKSNTRFVFHNLQPPSPYKTIDTRKIAKAVFKFDSNKLDELGNYLGLGRKLAHTGFDLWKKCMLTEDAEAWRLMKEYNGQDILLLEQVYYRMRPWAKTHPQVNQGDLQACPKCGSYRVQRRGFSFTLLRKKQRFQCQECTGWFEGAAVAVEKKGKK
jgi:uncharacterized protein YprB with RNaseH-like and TPR domain